MSTFPTAPNGNVIMMSSALMTFNIRMVLFTVSALQSWILQTKTESDEEGTPLSFIFLSLTRSIF
jgi:hypothetical protein